MEIVTRCPDCVCDRDTDYQTGTGTHRIRQADGTRWRHIKKNLLGHNLVFEEEQVSYMDQQTADLHQVIVAIIQCISYPISIRV